MRDRYYKMSRLQEQAIKDAIAQRHSSEFAVVTIENHAHIQLSIQSLFTKKYVTFIKANGTAFDQSQFHIMPNTKIHYDDGIQLHLKDFNKVTLTESLNGEKDQKIVRMHFDNVTFYNVDWKMLFEQFTALKTVVFSHDCKQNDTKNLKAKVTNALKEYQTRIKVTFNLPGFKYDNY